MAPVLLVVGAPVGTDLLGLGDVLGEALVTLADILTVLLRIA